MVCIKRLAALATLLFLIVSSPSWAQYNEAPDVKGIGGSR